MDSFLKFLGFGKNQGKLDSKDFYPKFNYRIEFLRALNKTSSSKLFGLNTYWEGRFNELLGNLTPIVENFLSSGLLEISLKEESLTIKELKEILRENELPVSGNKEDLVKRVFERVENKSYLRNLDSLYKLTPEGKKEIYTYKENFQKEYSAFLTIQAKLFSQGKVKEFESNHFRLYNSYPDQRTLGLSKSENFSERTHKILAHLKNGLEFRFNWNFDPESKIKLRSALALRAANFSNNRDFLNQFLDKVDLSEFKEYLETNNLKGKSTLELLEFFLDFEFGYLWNHYLLVEYKKMQVLYGQDNRFIGIQIWNKGCECEEKCGIEKFFWNEIDQIPTLPRTPNCRCHYSPYTESD